MHAFTHDVVEHVYAFQIVRRRFVSEASGLEHCGMVERLVAQWGVLSQAICASGQCKAYIRLAGDSAMKMHLAI